MELDVLASESGWATTGVQEVSSQPDFRVTFARMATRLLREMSRRHRIKDRAERAMSVVKAFSVAVPSGIQLKLDVQAASGVADSEQDLTDLLLEIGEVAQATGAGALFLIDGTTPPAIRTSSRNTASSCGTTPSARPSARTTWRR
jgi:hypothetical protein